MVFERNRLLYAIEVYIEDLEVIGVETGGESRNTLSGGVLRVLATGFCEDTPEPAGRHFEDLGFPRAGALADELGVTTCS